MSFRGFTVESKSYRSYDKMTLKEKMFFWKQFPFAWARFIFSPIREWIEVQKYKKL